jgi:hypothetical protein
LKLAKPDFPVDAGTNSNLIEIEDDLCIPESELYATLLGLSITPETVHGDDNIDVGPPEKRQRLDEPQDDDQPHYNKLVLKLTELLSGERRSSLHKLQDEMA